MNRYEKRLLEDLKINRSEDVLRRKRKDNIDLRTFSAVRTNTVEWLKISDDECVFELNAGYGELVDLLSARCRKLYVCAVGASSEDIISMRSRRNRNVEVISKKDDIITFLSGSDVDRLIIHDVPLAFASKNSLIDLVHKAMETHIPYIDIIFDSADSWHYHSGSGVSGTGRIKKKYEELSFSYEEIEKSLNGCSEYHREVFSCLPDNTFPMVIRKDCWPGEQSFTLELEKEKASYEEMYSYANDRSEAYMLKTVIDKDTVRKEALNIYSLPFLKRMNNNAKILSVQYKEGWRLAENRMKGDVLYIEKVNGRKLQDILDKALIKGDKETYYDWLERYLSFMRNSHNDTYFSVTDEFRRYFGTVKDLDECRCGILNNIDLVFDNIIVDEDKYRIIDHEWTFDFPVPVDFIIYRAIYYLYVSAQGHMTPGMFKESLEYCHIDEKMRSTFADMEAHFQKEIMNGLPRCRDIVCKTKE